MSSKKETTTQGPANPQNPPPPSPPPPGQVVVDPSQFIAALTQFFRDFPPPSPGTTQSTSTTTTQDPFQNPEAQSALTMFNDIVAGLRFKFVPVAPSPALTAISATEVEVKWTEETNNADGFKLARCTGPNCQDFTVIQQLPRNARSFRDTNLTANTSYSYKLTSFNSRGETPSTVVTVTTPST